MPGRIQDNGPIAQGEPLKNGRSKPNCMMHKVAITS